jgi:predicted nucleic acid-binding protein
MSRYTELKIGLTDASLVVLAERYGTNRIGTYDRRYFRAVKPISGGWFDLLPEG